MYGDRTADVRHTLVCRDLAEEASELAETPLTQRIDKLKCVGHFHLPLS